MAYPTMEQYQTSLQHPATAFLDSELKRGNIKKTGLGLPQVQTGGFALTYAVDVSSGRTFAVKCFHKESRELETRYDAIDKKLRSLHSPYFIDFGFQKAGVRIDGALYPVVKMAWAPGVTLGEFVGDNYRNPNAMRSLRESLRKLALFLEGEGIAHGDIQIGNVMVGGGGSQVYLIDYDGIFVEDIGHLGCSEFGHRNFQHPGRMRSQPFDGTLDRFSFITIDFALLSLEKDPDVWLRSKSDGDCLVFRANDFADPGNSNILAELSRCQDSALQLTAGAFSRVCSGSYESVPRLNAFLSKGVPVTVQVHHEPPARKVYMGPYPVLRAADYAQCYGCIGDLVELVGQVHGVTDRVTVHGKPYCFINFGHWQQDCVKVTIWSEGLQQFREGPSRDWEGEWISVVGLLEPPYRSAKHGYSHVSIGIRQASKVTRISREEAEYRLRGDEGSPYNGVCREPHPGSGVTGHASMAPTAEGGRGVSRRLPSSARSKNSEALERIRRASGAPAAASGGTSLPSSSTPVVSPRRVPQRPSTRQQQQPARTYVPPPPPPPPTSSVPRSPSVYLPPPPSSSYPRPDVSAQVPATQQTYQQKPTQQTDGPSGCVVGCVVVVIVVLLFGFVSDYLRGNRGRGPRPSHGRRHHSRNGGQERKTTWTALQVRLTLVKEVGRDLVEEAGEGLTTREDEGFPGSGHGYVDEPA